VIRRLRGILGDQRGNTAIIFGLAIVPLLALGGGSVDFAQRARIHGALQSASDTAALAAARLVQNGQMRREEDWEALRTQAETNARNFVTASLVGLGATGIPDVTIDITEQGVTIGASYDMSTSFLGVIGINKLPAKALSEVAMPAAILVEIALVLDYSGSMLQNDKYIRMRNAATAFIQKVGEDRPDRSKIGIVPFSRYVFAELPGATIRDTLPGEAMLTMNACISNRGYPYSTTNESPYTTIAESRWPQIDPDGADCELYADNSLRVRDLTDDFDGLVTAIAAMQPANLTNISLATEVGWHMLSPDQPFDTARDYSDEALRKILVLLTDGKQTVEAEGPSGGTSVGDANETTAELCTNIKGSGIRLFTIAYDVDDTSVYSLLSGCASGPDEYHEVHDASDISDVFETIYDQIAETAWLSK
jgi:Flp pilus assembly protein TadG